MCYYIDSEGRRAELKLRNSLVNLKIAEVVATQQSLQPIKLQSPPPGFPPGYPSFAVLTHNGVTEVIEHRQMEPIFYINEDPDVLAEILRSDLSTSSFGK